MPLFCGIVEFFGRALLWEYRALLWEYRALLWEYGAALRGYRALVDASGSIADM